MILTNQANKGASCLVNLNRSEKTIRGLGGRPIATKMIDDRKYGSL